MKEIPLTQGMVAKVDDEDYALLIKSKWRAFKSGQTWYAVTGSSDAHSMWYMHEVIMGCTIALGAQYDHIDRDGLNNQRLNLRQATRSQNQANAPKHRNNTSGYKGVCYLKARHRWQAQIQVKGQLKYLGIFLSKESAARAYDKAALQYFGEYAHLNFSK